MKKKPKRYIGLYIFIFGIIFDYLLLLYDKIRYGDHPDATPFAFGAIVGIIIIFTEFYGVFLSIYYFFKKYPKVWIPPALNSLGLIIAVGFAFLQMNIYIYKIHFNTFNLGIEIFHGLKIISLFLALKFAFFNKNH